MKETEDAMQTNPTARTDDETFLADVCKGLAHPARVSILRRLLAEDRCVCGRLVEGLPLAQSTVSQHLKILKNAGLVRGEVEGPRTCYCIDRETLARFAPLVRSLLRAGLAKEAS
ncbi:regulatory protein ArsR [Pseudodesulfovibrio mercurii]|uniref:Regulatory protein ArsR n=1 Tax=Pseudodesulfovibrio mercurii TaxID=641491 RepID=F0JBE8_9BACT|nr:metalloregulator ArsR/SmtB family transcription factor [Pseudodesulfovibrio mercurii]EGB14267.1 regulatory protein ArsR [Pseudodesulfovibrio mercurii]